MNHYFYQTPPPCYPAFHPQVSIYMGCKTGRLVLLYRQEVLTADNLGRSFSSDPLRLVAAATLQSHLKCAARQVLPWHRACPAGVCIPTRPLHEGDDRTKSIIFITNTGGNLQERPLTLTQACAILRPFQCALALNIVAASVFWSVAQRRPLRSILPG